MRQARRHRHFVPIVSNRMLRSNCTLSNMPAPTADDLLSLAVRHVNAGQSERAVSLCEHALAHQPPHAGVLQLLALLNLKRGFLGPAAEQAQASLALRPGHTATRQVAVDAWFQLALRHQDAREFEAAVAALRSVLQLAPELAEAEVNLGIVLQELGRVDEAMQAYCRAYKLREDTFGRIAHALAAPRVGRVWLRLDDLRADLRTSLQSSVSTV